MFDYFFLTLLIFLPSLGAVLLAFVPKGKEGLARFTAGNVAFLSFLQALCLVQRFDFSDGNFQFSEARNWISALNVKYVLGVDGLSLWLIVLTTLLTFLVIVASTSIEKNLRAYLACLLILETGMLGAFCALEGFTFYIFWELMLIPMYFLIGVWGGGRRIYSAIKFVLYTAFGSLLMLVAIVYLALLCKTQFGEMSFLLSDWMRLSFSGDEATWLFLAFALAFAIKVPVFPFHTWLPDAHVDAPTGGSVILAGVLLKFGIYGLLRFAIPVFPEVAVQMGPYLALLGVIGIVYGALVAWVQTDIKKLVAYSSVSHMGFCVLGLAAYNFQGIQGSVLQMLNHGVSTAALFFLVGVLYDRKHTRLIADYGGLSAKVPVFSAVFLVFTLSSIGLPLTNGFIGEFLILLGGFKYNVVFGALAVSGVVLGAMYMLSLYRRVSFGEFNEEQNGDLTDLTLREKFVFAPLLVLVFVIGLYPQPILRGIEPSTKVVLSYLSEAKLVAKMSEQEVEIPEKKASKKVSLKTKKIKQDTSNSI